MKTKDLNYEYRINKLVEQYMNLVNSRRNERLKSYWIEKDNNFSVNLYRGDEPKEFLQIGTIPITVNPQDGIYAALYNYSLKDYYTVPEIYLEMLLRQLIAQFDIFMDDQFLKPVLPVWLGASYEYSIFGIETTYSDMVPPWISHEPNIKIEDELDNFENIDFNRIGLIPLAIKFYEVISKYLDGTGLKVKFPSFNRGPFGILAIIMGFENIFYNAVSDSSS